MKFKVENNNNFTVGIRYENNGTEINIRPNTHVLMSEEDILYVNSVSKLFERGVLLTKDQNALEKMGYIEQNPNTLSEVEAIELLKLSNARLKSELTKITEKHAIDKIISAGKKVDLSMAKIKIINDTLGIKIQEELDDEDII